jgi:DNA-directed RNA polymerase specialized sigma24 family protein
MDEVAGSLGIGVSAAKMRIKRGLDELRDRLDARSKR